MNADIPQSFVAKARRFVFGKALSPHDHSVFHNLSLIAFFAWVGLGADGLSSSCYGPEEAFLALQNHHFLAILVALASAVTVLVISASYSQIIELFPTGGGGYLVASKLLSPTVGMVSGCALLIDYVLTITISIASGADALFSFLPAVWHAYKLGFAVLGVLVLTVMNLRGVKESVIPLVPVFLVFVATHVFVIVFTLGAHAGQVIDVMQSTVADWRSAQSELGFIGVLLVLLRAYSMGAGTYTGIEAVSNGLPILREPKAQTGKRTMTYMAFSLAFTATGLMVAYLLMGVIPAEGKTLNAVLFEAVTGRWGSAGRWFVLVTLVSEALLLFVAAQAGFLDGPRVMANMALDRWLPGKFAALSDRLVTQNGIILMGGGALAMMLLSRGSVKFMVVLYSINVFITFVLSQSGMVRHWWQERSRVMGWQKKLAVNGVGLALTGGILISVTVLKFHEGGWITLVLTGALVATTLAIRKHYRYTGTLLRRLDTLVEATRLTLDEPEAGPPVQAPFDVKERTAVVLVTGFNGLGLHTLFGLLRIFKGVFKNFVFVSVGVVDAGNFKGVDEVARLRQHIQDNLGQYVAYMHRHGAHAESYHAVGTDVVGESVELAAEIVKKYPNAVFFGGQLLFPRDSVADRMLHNYTVFAIQKQFYRQGMPFVLLPIRV